MVVVATLPFKLFIKLDTELIFELALSLALIVVVVSFGILDIFFFAELTPLAVLSFELKDDSLSGTLLMLAVDDSTPGSVLLSAVTLELLLVILLRVLFADYTPYCVSSCASIFTTFLPPCRVPFTLKSFSSSEPSPAPEYFVSLDVPVLNLID